ncbi:MAG: hypothetical protein ACYC4Q_09190, partial [Victivallaceae bacterium]
FVGCGSSAFFTDEFCLFRTCVFFAAAFTFFVHDTLLLMLRAKISTHLPFFQYNPRENDMQDLKFRKSIHDTSLLSAGDMRLGALTSRLSVLSLVLLSGSLVMNSIITTHLAW